MPSNNGTLAVWYEWKVKWLYSYTLSGLSSNKMLIFTECLKLSKSVHLLFGNPGKIENAFERTEDPLPVGLNFPKCWSVTE